MIPFNTNHAARITVGPILFHWPVEKKMDFYARLAASAPVDTVYLGEVVCAKRVPSSGHFYEDIAQFLKKAGKTIVRSTLAEVMTKFDRQLVERTCTMRDTLIEANDTSALYHLCGRPHALGPFLNIYNEYALEFLASKGASHVTFPPELPGAAIARLAQCAKNLGMTAEVQVYGRVPLALSARCYHARVHGRVKDNCRFVCGEDPDGMVLKTLEGIPFLSINGIQTLSHACLNLLHEMPVLADLGVTHFRISPHSGDIVETCRLFRAVLDGEMSATEASNRLEALAPGPFANGFYHRAEGYQWIHTS